MHFPAKLVSFCLILLSTTSIYAQDKVPIKFGKVSVDDFKVQSKLIDSSTNAIVIADIGESQFISNQSEGTISMIYKRKKRIKIINKNGFDAATITIPLYIGNNGKPEKLEDLDAFTYNLQDGKVVRTKVEKSSVFTENVSKNWSEKKFTFPALAEGSIIEYSLEIKSDYYFNLQAWNFQGEYPVLWSQYDAGIPEFYKYVILSQGYQSFFINKSKQSSISFTFTEHVDQDRGSFNRAPSTSSSIQNFKIDGLIDYYTWVMKDVPALKEEPFTTTLENAIARIEFQLKEIAYPNQFPKTMMSNWQKVSEEMLNDEDFGLPIKRANNWLDDEVTLAVKGANTPEEKARRIYAHVRDHYTCTNFNRYRISGSLRDVVKNSGGTVADINMLLIAMLRSQDIAADPVLLSTRNHGYTNEIYPLMSRFNYVVARVKLGDQPCYLDAATPRLGFNRLPQQAYNGHARVINKEASPVYFMPDSVTEANNTMVFIQNNEKGGVEGAVTNELGYFHSLSVRNLLAKKNIEAFKKEIQDDLSEDVAVSAIGIDSLKLLDENVKIHYEIQLKSFGEADIVYFNPMLAEGIKKNPFVAAERFYPVEMPYTINELYTLNMEVPKGYVIDELPKSVRLMFNEDEGMFEYLVSTSEGTIQMRCRLQLKKATYANEDYQSLRDFYAYIVKKEAEQIVFKKAK